MNIVSMSAFLLLLVIPSFSSPHLVLSTHVCETAPAEREATNATVADELVEAGVHGFADFPHSSSDALVTVHMLEVCHGSIRNCRERAIEYGGTRSWSSERFHHEHCTMTIGAYKSSAHASEGKRDSVCWCGRKVNTNAAPTCLNKMIRRKTAQTRRVASRRWWHDAEDGPRGTSSRTKPRPPHARAPMHLGGHVLDSHAMRCFENSVDRPMPTLAEVGLFVLFLLHVRERGTQYAQARLVILLLSAIRPTTHGGLGGTRSATRRTGGSGSSTTSKLQRRPSSRPRMRTPTTLGSPFEYDRAPRLGHNFDQHWTMLVILKATLTDFSLSP